MTQYDHITEAALAKVVEGLPEDGGITEHTRYPGDVGNIRQDATAGIMHFALVDSPTNGDKPPAFSLDEMASRMPHTHNEFEPADRSQEVFALSRNQDSPYKIDIKSDVTEEQYRAITPQWLWDMQEREAIELLQRAEEQERDEVILEIGTTFEGGGVAKLVPSFMHQLNLIGEKAKAEGRSYTVEGHWLVALPSPKFAVTKKLHNGQQDVLPDGETFTEEDKADHLQLATETFDGIKDLEVLKRATKIIIDDFQLAGLVGLLKDYDELRPDVEIIIRNHINTDREKMATEGSLQHDIKRHLHETCGVDRADVYIAHPIEKFVPYGTQNVAFIPPPIDRVGNLDRYLTPEQRQEQLKWLGRQVGRQNRERQALLTEYFDERYGVGGWPQEWAHIDDQEPPDPEREWMTGFARFDWAKQQWLNMELAKRVTDKMHDRGAPEKKIPHWPILGNGATDDTDRARVLNKMLELQSTKYKDYKKYMTIVSLEHNYDAENAILRRSKAIAHLASAEGFEHIPTAAATKEEKNEVETGVYGAVPGIVSPAGGLTLQVEDGVNGNIVDHIWDTEDFTVLEGSKLDSELDRVAKQWVEYILDPDKYKALVKRTRDRAEVYHKIEFGPVANMVRFLRVFNGKVSRQWKVTEMVDDPEPVAA